MSTTESDTTSDISLLRDVMYRFDGCGQTVLMPGSHFYKLLEREDAVYCPRCARDLMADAEWGLR